MTAPVHESRVVLHAAPTVGRPELVTLGINDPEWVWGRGARRVGSSVTSGFNPTELSRRALVIAHRGRRVDGAVVDTAVIVSTAQGSARSSGGVDILDTEGGLLHRLSGARQPQVRLFPGSYQLVVRILDPVCVVDLTFERGSGAFADADPDDDRTQNAWSLDQILARATADDQGPFAVGLIAAACVQSAELRAGRTVSDTFDTAVRLLIGRGPDWSREMLRLRCEQQGISVPLGSARLSYVAEHTKGLVDLAQLAEVTARIVEAEQRSTSDHT
jgi:hypothetical protein